MMMWSMIFSLVSCALYTGGVGEGGCSHGLMSELWKN
jgi:hypothetical protein